MNNILDLENKSFILIEKDKSALKYNNTVLYIYDFGLIKSTVLNKRMKKGMPGRVVYIADIKTAIKITLSKEKLIYNLDELKITQIQSEKNTKKITNKFLKINHIFMIDELYVQKIKAILNQQTLIKKLLAKSILKKRIITEKLYSITMSKKVIKENFNNFYAFIKVKSNSNQNDMDLIKDYNGHAETIKFSINNKQKKSFSIQKTKTPIFKLINSETSTDDTKSKHYTSLSDSTIKNTLPFHGTDHIFITKEEYESLTKMTNKLINQTTILITKIKNLIHI